MYQNNRQGGSVITFLVVGIILAALALGAVYGVRQFMASQRLAPIADSDIAQDTDGNGTADEGIARNPTQSEGDSETEADGSGATGGTPSTDQSSLNGTQPSGRLPQSGPETGFVNVLGLSLTVAMIAVYLKSRQTAL